MQLVLERCTIRPWRLDDGESLASMRTTAKYGSRYAIFFRIRTRSKTRPSSLQRAMTEQPATIFCIEVEGVAAGVIDIRLGQDVHRQTAGLGYWLGEEFWGRGIVTEAVATFTDFCFENFPLRRIYAEVFANNPASARVLEKAGFVFEGRLKNNVFKDGQLLVSRLYAGSK